MPSATKYRPDCDRIATVRYCPRGSRGSSLLVVLVLVLILGLMSVMGLRASTFTTNVAGNVRSQALALEAAEAALRFCETQLSSATPLVIPLELPEAGAPVATRWQTFANWNGPSKLSATIPADYINSTNSKQTYAVMPECMVERLRLPVDTEQGADEAYLITARGFSPDTSLSSNGQLRSGSEAWVQSTIQN